MPDTLVALTIAVAAVLPGFVTVELTQRQRAVQSGGDAQSAVLRALFYALLIHLRGPRAINSQRWTKNASSPKGYCGHCGILPLSHRVRAAR
jgi:hypothetical protein